TGEDVTAEELGGADVHARRSGVVDHLANDDAHALALTREIVRHLGDPPPQPWQRQAPSEPAFDPAELHGAAGSDLRRPFAVREIIARIVDGSPMQEWKPLYVDRRVCSFDQ